MISAYRPLVCRVFSTSSTYCSLSALFCSESSNFSYLPWRARLPVILNGYFSSGTMTIRVFKGAPTGPRNLTCLGFISTNFSTKPVTAISSQGLLTSLVFIRTLSLILRPPYPFVLTLTVSFPLPPAGIRLALETAVHPQPVLIFSMTRVASPLFCKINRWETSVPSTTGSNS